MPGKHVRFEMPSTPQSNSSPSFSPTSSNQSGPSQPFPPVVDLSPYLSRERLIRCDLTLPPVNAQVYPGFTNDQATQPALPSMMITCEVSPRPIPVVESQSGRGVTVMDVLYAIYTFLRTPASKSDFTQLSPDMQRKVYDAFQLRYRSIGDEKTRIIEEAKGLKLVDMLGRNKMFAGLHCTARDPEVWQLCLSSS